MGPPNTTAPLAKAIPTWPQTAGACANKVAYPLETINLLVLYQGLYFDESTKECHSDCGYEYWKNEQDRSCV